MKAKFLILSGVLVFSACATGPSVYGPAQGRGLGFQEQQIENNRFQVSYTARTADEARNLSLLRAAELTQAQGYNYFRVIGSETSGQNARRSNVSTSVGVGVGSGGGYRRG
ncbi:MAG TPA: hypothetical protein ENJ46_04660, partial [Hellea balneolensis]|nr:hypothetical protein [Hellea balneolensis]